MAYQIEVDGEVNRIQVNDHPRVKLVVTLGWGQKVKRSNIIKFLREHGNLR